MKINTSFEILDKVSVESLDYKGFINAIYVDRAGIRYEVKYFVDGEPKYHYFEPDELRKLDSEESGLGFAQN